MTDGAAQRGRDRWRAVFPTVLAFVLAAAVAACGSSNTTASSTAAPASTPAAASNALKIGVLATCGGSFSLFEAESFDGAKYALIKYAGGKAAGTAPEGGVTGATIAVRPVALYFGCTDATPDKAVAEARRLVESVKVNILVGPLSGDEGLAIANYAKTQPQVTFVNGTSGAQATTLTIKAPNFFRFGGDGAQWMAGLGSYAYNDLHWRTAAIIGEDYSYPYTQAAGFIKEFCGLGGQITKRVWVPLGTTDWSSSVADLPRNVNGVLVLTGGADTIDVLKSYSQLGNTISGHALGGSSVLDPTAFSVGGQMVGLAGGSPVPLGSTNPQWADYVNGFQKVYSGVSGESLFTALYYDDMKAVIDGLNQVKGSLSNNEAAFKKALAGLKETFPNGSVRLDQNRNSIQPAYVVQVVNSGGKLAFKVLRTVPDITQTFGGAFSASSPAPSRASPACTKGPLPPWASGA